jgi:hypothetical protein
VIAIAVGQIVTRPAHSVTAASCKHTVTSIGQIVADFGHSVRWTGQVVGDTGHWVAEG